MHMEFFTQIEAQLCIVDIGSYRIPEKLAFAFRIVAVKLTECEKWLIRSYEANEQSYALESGGESATSIAGVILK